LSVIAEVKTLALSIACYLNEQYSKPDLGTLSLKFIICYAKA